MLRSRVAAEVGWFSIAIEDANALVERSVAQVPIRAHRCRILASANQQLDQALRDCNAALRMDRDYEEALMSRALVQLRRGAFSQAARDYTAALAEDASLAEARFGRGIAHIRMGQAAQGQADLAAARALSPTIEQYFDRLDLSPEPRQDTAAPD
jgi:tetratricopeptide (TPR) repeat protein